MHSGRLKRTRRMLAGEGEALLRAETEEDRRRIQAEFDELASRLRARFKEIPLPRKQCYGK